MLNVYNLALPSSPIIENEFVCGLEEGFNTAITGMNRGLTVAIAVYRYCLVFYPYSYIGDHAQRRLKLNTIGIIIGKRQILSCMFFGSILNRIHGT